MSAASIAGEGEITLIAPGGIRSAIERMIPMFAGISGHTVLPTYGSGGGTKERVLRGEMFDVPIVQPPLAEIVRSGHIIADSEMPLAKVRVGVAVRKGAPRPDISTVDSVKRMLFAARAVSYPTPANGAAAGVSFTRTLKSLGILEAMQSRIKTAQGGRRAMAMLASGEIDIGLTFISEIISEPGVELVGPLPANISPPTGLVAFVHAASTKPDIARAFLRYLSSPEAALVYREHGLDPETRE